MDTSLPWLDEAHLRLLGRGLLVLGLPVVAVMAFLGPVKPAKGTLPRGFRMPMLAIELPRSEGEVAAILAASGKATASDPAADGARRMKNGLLLDLGIILLYGCTLAALGVLLYQSPDPGPARIAGAAAAVLGVGAGLARNPFLEAAMQLMVLTLLGAILLFAFRPGSLLRLL